MLWGRRAPKRAMMQPNPMEFPLQIAELSCGSGILGLTHCPGMNTDDAHTRRMGGTIYRRKLSNDLEDIRRWGACSIVTLLERHEFGRLGVSGLGKAIEALAINWYQMPIRDMQAPAEEFEDAWASHAPALRSQLQAGERILIHCRQGRGRTGTVAASLLVDSGVGPADAITTVRSVAPACISSPVQEDYILGLQSGSGL